MHPKLLSRCFTEELKQRTWGGWGSVLGKPSKALLLFNEGSNLRKGIDVLFRVAGLSLLPLKIWCQRGHLQPGRGSSPESNLAGALTLDFQPLTARDKILSFTSHSDYGIYYSNLNGLRHIYKWNCAAKFQFYTNKFWKSNVEMWLWSHVMC